MKFPYLSKSKNVNDELLLKGALQIDCNGVIPKNLLNDHYGVKNWTNFIRTSCYNVWTFLPLNLFQQITMPSNMYFLVMAMLQLIEPISDSGGIPTTLVPLCFVMSVTMLKDAYEDINRHRSDNKENNKVCRLISAEGISSARWHELRPGNLILVKVDEAIPADCILLSCSDSYGISYVETVQLDGETNLKDKVCIPELHQLFPTPESFVGVSHDVGFSFAPPDARLYNFTGSVKLFSHNRRTATNTPDATHRSAATYRSVPTRVEETPNLEFGVNINQLLWRGSSLSNTSWVVGAVVYTGHNTKIFKNSRGRVLKFSKLIKTYNRHAILLACTQFLLCLIAAISYSLQSNSDSAWYLSGSGDNSGNTPLARFLSSLGAGFGRFVLLLSYFVPITLFVQLEMIKWCQGYFLSKDNSMTINGVSPGVSTVSLMEELGCVTHIFSDKTGTLTLNLMQLKVIGIGRAIYGGNAQEPCENVEPDKKTLELYKLRRSPNQYVDFDAWQFLLDIEKTTAEEKTNIRNFFLVLGLCHSVLPKSEMKANYDCVMRGGQPLTGKKLSSESSSSSNEQGGDISARSVIQQQQHPTINDDDDDDAAAASPPSRAPLISEHHEFPSTSAGRSFRKNPNDKYERSAERETNSESYVVSNSHESRQTVADHATAKASVAKERVLDPNKNLLDDAYLPKISPERLQATSPAKFHKGARKVTPDRNSDADHVDRRLAFSPNKYLSERKHMQTLPHKSYDRSKLDIIRWSKKLNQPMYDASSPDELSLISGSCHIGVYFIRRPTLTTIQLALTNKVVRNIVLLPEEVAILENMMKERGIEKFGDVFNSYNPLYNWDKEINESLLLDESSKKGIDFANLSEDDIIYIPTVLFDVIEVLEFDNIRKKMSIIGRDGYGTLRLYAKGADSSMMASARSDFEDGGILKEQLYDLSSSGLRTLVFGYKDLTETDVAAFRAQLGTARTSGSDEDLSLFYDAFERNLDISGCTGIDDKLQPQVPQVVADIRNANIKLWVLTGDKLETAISIGHSCNVLTDATYNAVINGTTESQVREQLHQYMTFVIAGQLAQDAFDRLNINSDKESEISVSCGGRCFPRKSYSQNRSRQNKSINIMKWEDFVNAITFQARKQPVSTQPQTGRSKHHLSSLQVEIIIEEYLRSFDQAESNKKPSSKSAQKDLQKFAHSQDHGKPPPLSSPVSSTSSLKHYSEEYVPSLEEYGDLVLKSSLSDYINPDLSYYAMEENFAPLSLFVLESKVGASPTVRFSGSLIDDSANVAASPPPSFSEENDSRQVEQYNQVAITCTGEALGIILSSEQIKRYFFGLANLCATVIACRVTPKQKAEVVKESARYLPGTISLAIGDGANDVGMIVTANVGVGLSGNEGVQAVRAADFSISEFRLLRNLLFHHGHESLRRNGIQVYHTVYKNVVFGVADWFYGFLSGFSAIDLYNSWLKQVFNVFFTSFPPLIYSAFDRVLPADIFINCPWLYPVALRPDGELYFGNKRFVIWFVFGVTTALIITFLTAFGLSRTPIHQSGKIGTDASFYGQAIFYGVVVASNLVPVPFINTYFWFVPLGFFLCFISWYGFWAVCNSGITFCPELLGSLGSFYTAGSFHLTLIITMTVMFIPLALWWSISTLFFPNPMLIIRERIALGVFDVVVAPQRLGSLAVIVPRMDNEAQWRGFAFSEGANRFQLHRRLSVLPRNVLSHAAAFGNAAGGFFFNHNS